MQSRFRKISALVAGGALALGGAFSGVALDSAPAQAAYSDSVTATYQCLKDGTTTTYEASPLTTKITGWPTSVAPGSTVSGLSLDWKMTVPASIAAGASKYYGSTTSFDLSVVVAGSVVQKLPLTVTIPTSTKPASGPWVLSGTASIPSFTVPAGTSTQLLELTLPRHGDATDIATHPNYDPTGISFRGQGKALPTGSIFWVNQNFKCDTAPKGSSTFPVHTTASVTIS